jgi:hypothetical protein
MTADTLSELTRLQAENLRLKELLRQHNIVWDNPSTPVSSVIENSASDTAPTDSPTHLSPAEKIALFRKLFRGRTDVYWRTTAVRAATHGGFICLGKDIGIASGAEKRDFAL